MNRTLRETILWIGAGLGTLCLAWTAAMLAFGLTPLVFTSGSMSPAIEAGDLAFATTVPADELAEGDVVSVIDDRGVRITHRVTGIDPQDDGGAVLQLQGDANASPDEQAYNVDEVERVSFSVPKAGYVINAVNSPFGMFVIGLLVAAILVIAFRRDGGGGPDASAEDDSDDAAPDDRGLVPDHGVGHRVRRVVGVGAGAGALLVASGLGLQPTMAAFGDSPMMVSGALGAASVQAPATFTCTNVGGSGASVNLTFPHQDARYDYVVTIVNDQTGATVANRGGTITGAGTVGAAQTVNVARNFTPWGLFDAGAVQYTARVSSRLKSSTTWTSSDVTLKLYETRGLFEFSYRTYCGTA
ncbi:signal peptidase I [Aeromicrobium sp. HA]|uniref:signal peptidase I n=1 Tax=Aeromicrobium sp. HA TaxID=3009077 RepID=UPI0022AFCC8D|nr:signal peptidase I [Aeromicrobium sp. HA]